MVVQGHSRLSNCYTNQHPVCDFLVVLNSNLSHIFLPFPRYYDDNSRNRRFYPPLSYFEAYRLKWPPLGSRDCRIKFCTTVFGLLDGENGTVTTFIYMDTVSEKFKSRWFCTLKTPRWPVPIYAQCAHRWNLRRGSYLFYADIMCLSSFTFTQRAPQ